MPPVRLALVSQVDEISTTELRRVAGALGTQIRRDLAPHWHVEGTVEVFPAVTDVPIDCWPVLIRSETEVPGSLGMHLDQNGQPFALVAHTENWPMVASTQCLEMLVDPFGNRLVSGPSPKDDQGRVNFLVEVCDPCAHIDFAYEIDGVTVANFVTPRYYDAADHEGPTLAGPGFDFTGAITREFEVLRGGMLSWHDPASDHWWQLVFFGEQLEFKDLGPLDTAAAAPEEEIEDEKGEEVAEEGAEAAEVESEAALPIEASRAGQLPGAANDQVPPLDQLGFRDYVTAFVRLITSRDTTPPITIGIFGSWGVGKSFLLRHIRDELRSFPADGRDDGGEGLRVHVVELNAWSYSASKAVWPSLVRSVMECGEKAVTWRFPGRLVTKFWENLIWEIRRERGKLLGALFAGLVLLTFVLWRFDFDVGLLTAGAAALGAAGLIKVIADTLANPLSRWMTVVLKSSEYGEDIGYMSRIQHDLEKLSKRLGKNNRIVVLIDDLDRCEPDKMVEVLQAINLLLNFQSFIVCLGIDARVVTRAIERHYDGLLQESHASGYEYLDKIVQIPFRIPRPSDQDVQSFLATQLRDRQEEASRPRLSRADGQPSAGMSESSLGAAAAVAAKNQVPKVEIDPEAAEPVAFTEEEIAAFQELAPFLEPNPRHLKRIVNVYRLVRSLATIRRERFVLEDPAGAIRLLACAAQWPYTLAAMFDRLDDMVDAEAAGATWPSADPLPHLYAEVRQGLDRTRQAQLDRDLEDLDRLLTKTSGRLSWKALASLRRYIVNFNPAVEEELRVALATDVAAGSLAPPTSKPKPSTKKKPPSRQQGKKSASQGSKPARRATNRSGRNSPPSG